MMQMHRRHLCCWLTALFFIAAGANHFRRPAIYARIIPRMLPHPTQLVSISGLCEILGGVGLLFPKSQRAAAWGLILLLIAVFPANIFMAIDADQFADWQIPKWILWARLPMQPLLIAWVWLISQPLEHLTPFSSVHSRNDEKNRQHRRV